MLNLSTTSIPSLTNANGEKPIPSRFALSARLMNSCVVRDPGPAVANESDPRLFVSRTGSSLIFAVNHAADTFGSDEIPN